MENRVEERTKELLEANRNLERSNMDLQQFAYVATHDLQEPLRKIILFTGRLNNDYLKDLPEKARDYMKRIINSAKLLSELINDLLNFSRLKDKNEGYRETDLNTILKEVLADLDETIKAAESFS